MRVNKTITITAGTPVNIFTGGAAADPDYTDPRGHLASRVFIQMLHGAGDTFGLGYVMAGITRARVPAIANAGDVTAELAPASTTSPGGDYSDRDDANPMGGIDVNEIWVDGTNTGDTVKVSYDLKN